MATLNFVMTKFLIATTRMGCLDVRTQAASLFKCLHSLWNSLDEI